MKHMVEKNVSSMNSLELNKWIEEILHPINRWNRSGQQECPLPKPRSGLESSKEKDLRNQ